jgi:WD40 repeat protein
MTLRSDNNFRSEWEAFDADVAAARAAFEAGEFSRAVDLVISPRHKFYYGQDPERFKLLSDLYELLGSPVDEQTYRENPWQSKLMAELYSVWPKQHLEGAFLKHSFPEPPADDYAVSGSQSIHLARSSVGLPLGSGRPVALSRGRRAFKFWDVETGRVIHTYEQSLYTSAAAFGRDSSHLLFAYEWEWEGELRWSTSFRETARMISTSRGKTKSDYANTRRYALKGKIVEVDRSSQLVTVEHEAIEDYLPAQTSRFQAIEGYYGPKVYDLWDEQITADLMVEDDESWLANIVAPGRGLRGIRNAFTTPITAVCISSDGSLALANGNGENFGMWNVWTADQLREFKGHDDRVTCLCLSIDASFALSGSEDKTLKLWKPVTAECVHTFAGHESAITAVCLSLDCTRILSADHDGVIKVWNRVTGECLRTIAAHSQSVSALHLTVDGRFAVSGSYDKTVKVWNLDEGTCMRTFEHSDWVTSVGMTPDGKYLVAGSYEGTRVWELLWRLEPREVTDWDEGARPYLEILMNANGAWAGKLGTGLDMTEAEIEQTLQREGPSWQSWHMPEKEGLWHLNWNIRETLGHAGYGWLDEGVGRESNKIMDDWQREHPD